MSFARATFTAAGQSTRDNPSNPKTFTPGVPVAVMASDGGAFSGAFQVRRSFEYSPGNWTAFEYVDGWDQTDLPLTRQYDPIPGVQYDIYCLSCAAGSLNVSLGHGC